MNTQSSCDSSPYASSRQSLPPMRGAAAEALLSRFEPFTDTAWALEFSDAVGVGGGAWNPHAAAAPDTFCPPTCAEARDFQIPRRFFLAASRDKEALLEEKVNLKTVLNAKTFQLFSQKLQASTTRTANRKLGKALEKLELARADAPRTGGSERIQTRLKGLRNRVEDLRKLCEEQRAEICLLRKDFQLTHNRETEVERDVFAEEVIRLLMYMRRLKSWQHRLSCENRDLLVFKDKTTLLDIANKRLESCLAAMERSTEKAKRESAFYRKKVEASKLAAPEEKNCQDLEAQTSELAAKLEVVTAEKEKWVRKASKLEAEIRKVLRELRKIEAENFKDAPPLPIPVTLPLSPPPPLPPKKVASVPSTPKPKSETHVKVDSSFREEAIRKAKEEKEKKRKEAEALKKKQEENLIKEEKMKKEEERRKKANEREKEEELRRKEEEEEEEELLRKKEEERQRSEEEDMRRREKEVKRKIAEDEENRRLVELEAKEEQRRRVAEEEKRRKEAEITARKKEEESRRKMADDEARKLAAEHLERKIAEEEASHNPIGMVASQEVLEGKARRIVHRRKAVEEEARRKVLEEEAERKVAQEESRTAANEEEKRNAAEKEARTGAEEEKERRNAQDDSRRIGEEKITKPEIIALAVDKNTHNVDELDGAAENRKKRRTSDERSEQARGQAERKAKQKERQGVLKDDEAARKAESDKYATRKILEEAKKKWDEEDTERHKKGAENDQKKMEEIVFTKVEKEQQHLGALKRTEEENKREEENIKYELQKQQLLELQQKQKNENELSNQPVEEGGLELEERKRKDQETSKEEKVNEKRHNVEILGKTLEPLEHPEMEKIQEEQAKRLKKEKEKGTQQETHLRFQDQRSASVPTPKVSTPVTPKAIPGPVRSASFAARRAAKAKGREYAEDTKQVVEKEMSAFAKMEAQRASIGFLDPSIIDIVELHGTPRGRIYDGLGDLM